MFFKGNDAVQSIYNPLAGSPTTNAVSRISFPPLVCSAAPFNGHQALADGYESPGHWLLPLRL